MYPIALVGGLGCKELWSSIFSGLQEVGIWPGSLTPGSPKPHPWHTHLTFKLVHTTFFLESSPPSSAFPEPHFFYFWFPTKFGPFPEGPHTRVGAQNLTHSDALEHVDCTFIFHTAQLFWRLRTGFVLWSLSSKGNLYPQTSDIKRAQGFKKPATIEFLKAFTNWIFIYTGLWCCKNRKPELYFTLQFQKEHLIQKNSFWAWRCQTSLSLLTNPKHKDRILRLRTTGSFSCPLGSLATGFEDTNLSDQ